MTTRAWLVLIGMVGVSVWCLLGTSGCGPIQYVNQVTFDANASVAAARAVNAEKYSPYWYTLAVEYLHKAREEAAYADYQAANRFGRKSREAADMARDLAIQRAADPDDVSWKPPSEVGEPVEPDSPSPDSAAGSASDDSATAAEVDKSSAGNVEDGDTADSDTADSDTADDNTAGSNPAAGDESAGGDGNAGSNDQAADQPTGESAATTKDKDTAVAPDSAGETKTNPAPTGDKQDKQDKGTE